MTVKNAVNIVHEREKNQKPVYTPDINVRWQRVFHIFRNNLRLTTVHANTRLSTLLNYTTATCIPPIMAAVSIVDRNVKSPATGCSVEIMTTPLKHYV